MGFCVFVLLWRKKNATKTQRHENPQKIYSPYIRLRIKYDMLDIELFKEGKCNFMCANKLLESYRGQSSVIDYYFNYL